MGLGAQPNFCPLPSPVFRSPLSVLSVYSDEEIAWEGKTTFLRSYPIAGRFSHAACEIIGEAAKRIPDAVREAHDEPTFGGHL